MKRSIFPLVAVVALAGCETKPLQSMSYAEQKEFFSELHEICTEQGVKEGTDEMYRCIQQEINREAYERHENALRKERFRYALASTMDDIGDSYSNAPVQSRTVTCTSKPGGYISGPVTSVRTTCY